ncbi:MAG: glycine zipper 2TM domain-containing protein [Burkholderiaceae bacterium]|nr:glycine zipper 2TM domain-containing protein [Burkholderiaceae bacterium]
MSASIENSPTPGAAGGTRALWTVVGVLGVAVLAMGGALVYLQTQPAATPTAIALGPDGKPATLGGDGKPLPMVQDGPVPPPQKPVAKAAEKHPAPTPRPAPATAAVATPAVVQAPGPAPAPARAICTVCGTVESVKAVEHKPAGSGLGAVAGGVAGAVLGNQIGKGSGRTVATILGAVGGGVAGNVIERNVKKQTVYQMAVRMEDGSLRTVEKAAPVTVGARVTLDGANLRTSDGMLVPEVPAPAPAAQPQAAPSPNYNTGG